LPKPAPREQDVKKPRAIVARGQVRYSVRRKRLQGLGDPAGAQAAGADLDTSHRAAGDRLDLLKVGIPDAGGFIIGVTDVIAEARTFAADITDSGHGVKPP